MAKEKDKMLSGSLTLMLFTSISRVLGLVREMVSAALLGTGPLGDIFRVAFIIPNFLRRLFAEGTMATAFVPTFKNYLMEDDAQEIKDFLSASLTVLSVFVGFTVAIGMALSPVIIRIFFSTELSETVIQTRIMFPYLAFISFAALCQGILNANNSYAPSGFMPILFNIAVISFSLFLKDYFKNPARAMACGVLVGGFLQFTCHLPFVIKRGFRIGFMGLRKALRHSGVKKMGALIAPTIVGMAAYQVNDFVATSLASRAGTGIISSLLFSLRLQELVLGIVVVSISTVLLTELSQSARSERWEEYNEKLVRALKSMVLITVPIIAYAQLHGLEIISLLFKQAAFDDNSVFLTLKAFRWHISAILFIGFNRILAPVFYSLYDTKSPAIAGVISVLINILLVALLAGPFKGGGIALATSLAALANTAALLWALRRKSEISLSMLLKELFLYTVKIILISILVLLPIYYLKPVLLSFFAERGKVISLGLPITFDALIYFALGFIVLLLLGDPQVRGIIDLFIRKARKK